MTVAVNLGFLFAHKPNYFLAEPTGAELSRFFWKIIINPEEVFQLIWVVSFVISLSCHSAISLILIR